MVSQRPVVIFSKTSCCISHTVKSLLQDFGVSPVVYELDEIPRGRDIEAALAKLGHNPVVPAVFIGGKLVGGANTTRKTAISDHKYQRPPFSRYCFKSATDYSDRDGT